MIWEKANVLILCSIFLTALSLACQASHPPDDPYNSDTFPKGTVFVSYDRIHGRTYFASPHSLQVVGSNLKCSYIREMYPESLSVSADGTMLILSDTYNALVLRTSDLRVVRRLKDSSVWWDGSTLYWIDWLNGLAHIDRRVRSSRKLSSSIGDNGICAVDLTGRYFLSEQKIKPGTIANGNVPTWRLRLWRREKVSRFRHVCDLTTDTYDPASVGSPYRLAVVSAGLVVFGLPAGIDYNYICVKTNRTIIHLHMRGSGIWLNFADSLLVAQHTIVGLASTVIEGAGRIDLYLYQVSRAGIKVKPVAPNVVFVTYDAKRKAIGLGIPRKGKVVVEFQPVF